MTDNGHNIKYMSNPLTKKITASMNPVTIITISTIKTNVVLTNAVPPLISLHRRHYMFNLKMIMLLYTHFVHLLHYIFKSCHAITDQ